MRNQIQEHIQVLNTFYEKDFSVLQLTAENICSRLSQGSGIFIFGNGGSSAEAHHFSAELLGRFESDTRSAIKACCLSSDTATLTAVANDFGYDKVFSRQVEGLAKNGDILFGISTSGTSTNVLEAFGAGRKIGTTNILLTGGGKDADALSNVDVSIRVPSLKTAIIQELHLVIIHFICRVIDEEYQNGI